MDRQSQMLLMERHIDEGDTIIKEGESSDEFYLLKEGVAWAYRKEKKIGEIIAGEKQEFIGEVGALLGKPRVATVIAQSKCIVLAMPAKQLVHVINKAPTLGVKLACSLAHKLHDAMEIEVT